jgi:uncharacterized protein Yka (UPF0111/DUF47 family)
MFKYGLLILIIGSRAFAFLDSIVDTAKEAGQASAVIGSLGNLLEETNAATQQVKNLKELQDKIDLMNRQLMQMNELTEDTKKLIKGPEFSNVTDLATNVRFATEYIRTLKRFC